MYIPRYIRIKCAFICRSMYVCTYVWRSIQACVLFWLDGGSCWWRLWWRLHLLVFVVLILLECCARIIMHPMREREARSHKYVLLKLLLLSNLWVDDVDGADLLHDEGRAREDHEAAHGGHHSEHPQEQAVQDHGDDAPVLVLLEIEENVSALLCVSLLKSTYSTYVYVF